MEEEVGLPQSREVRSEGAEEDGILIEIYWLPKIIAETGLWLGFDMDG